MIAVLLTTLALSRISIGKAAESNRYNHAFILTPAPVVVTTLLVGDARDVFQKINFQRESMELKPLVWDEKLAKLAENYSKQMSDQKFFSHFDPDGRTIVERANEHEILDWLRLGENLYKSRGYLEPTDLAVDDWMESDSHYQNIIDPDWTHTGVGIYRTSDRETFITQVFMKK